MKKKPENQAEQIAKEDYYAVSAYPPSYPIDVGLHNHGLLRQESRTYTDGYHSHTFAFDTFSGEVILWTSTGGVHSHALGSHDAIDAEMDGSAHRHVIQVPYDIRLRDGTELKEGQILVTEGDGEHDHGADSVFCTNLDGAHSHALKVGGVTLDSMELEDILPRIMSLPQISVAKALEHVAISKADVDHQVVYGVVLEPESVDAEGDIVSAEEIEQAAHGFLKTSREIKFRHKDTLYSASVVESFIAPADMLFEGGPNGDQLVIKGSWVLGVYISDPEIWAMVKTKELNAFSVGGRAYRKPVDSDEE